MQEKNINGVWFEPTLGLLRLADPEPMKDLIDQVATKILYDQTPSEIHAFLIGEGMSEGDAYLTYQAGRIIAKSRAEAPTRPIEQFATPRYRR